MSSYLLTARDIKDCMIEPTQEGTNGQVLTTNGSGGRSWTTVQSGGAVESVNGKTGAVVLDNTDVGAAAENHTHTPEGIGAAAAIHTHAIADVNNLTSALNGKAASVHGHEMEDIDGLNAALSAKADTAHTHVQSDVEGLTDALSGKAELEHIHDMTDVTGLVSTINTMRDYTLTETASGSKYFTSDIDTGGRMYVGDDVYAVRKFTLLDLKSTTGSGIRTVTVMDSPMESGDILIQIYGGERRSTGAQIPWGLVYSTSDYVSVFIDPSNKITYRLQGNMDKAFTVIEYARKL